MSLRTAPAPKPKAAPRPFTPPPQRSKPVLAFRYVFIGLPMMAAYAVRRMPWWQRLSMLAAIIAILGVSGYYWFQQRTEKHRQGMIGTEWKVFEDASARNDLEGMEASLARLDGYTPNDPLVAKRRESLKKGEGAANDPIMIVYWMNRHIGENHLADAAREARKRIEVVEDDWQANCVLAHEALEKGDQATALKHLKAMPSPLAGRHPVGPGSLQYAFVLFGAMKLDDSSLRQYRATKVAPVLQKPEILKVEPPELIQLLQTYVAAFDDVEIYPELPNYWAGSSRIAQHLLDEPKTTTPMLVQLGNLQYRQLQVLRKLVAGKRLTLAKAQPLGVELAERLDDIWKKVRERNPKEPEGYFGAALIEHDRGRYAESLNYLTRGQEVCGDNQKLMATQLSLLQQHATPAHALSLAEKFAEKNPKQESIYRMLAQSAMNAGRPDKALEAARQAREIDPTQTWTSILEADILLQQDKAKEAAEVLKKFEKYFGKDPTVSELYVRSLCLSGKSKDVPEFLKKLVKDAPSPLVAIPSLRTAYREGLAADVAPLANELATRFTDYDLHLLTLVGDSNLVAAEPKTANDRWNDELVQKALRAYERILKNEPSFLAVAHNTAWLYLKAMSAADLAERTATPLRAAAAQDRLSKPMLSTLGIISLSQRRYDEARLFLLRSLGDQPGQDLYVYAWNTGDFANSSAAWDRNAAEKHVSLALAYYYLNDSESARQHLRTAAALPRSARVNQEFNLAQTLIDGKNP